MFLFYAAVSFTTIGFKNIVRMLAILGYLKYVLLPF